MQQPAQNLQLNPHAAPDDLNLVDLVKVLVRYWRHLVLVPVFVGGLAFGLSFLIKPQFTAKTTFLPPQAGGASVSAALSALGPLASLAGGGAAKGSGEMYVTLMQSETVADRLIDHFKLRELYKAQFQFETRDVLKSRSRIVFNKRDGVVSVEVDDTEPERAAQISNQYVIELKNLTANMAFSDAQRRRIFFEGQLSKAKSRLNEAQHALQSSGFSKGDLRAEPRAAAEEYAQIKGELAANEIQLKALKSRLTDIAPEVAQLKVKAAALELQMRSLEKTSEDSHSPDYISKYREFKYQESLFEQLAKQFEAARIEESKEDSSIQVIDIAQIPEWKSKPKRASIGLAAALISALILSVFLISRHIWRLNRSGHLC